VNVYPEKRGRGGAPSGRTRRKGTVHSGMAGTIRGVSGKPFGKGRIGRGKGSEVLGLVVGRGGHWSKKSPRRAACQQGGGLDDSNAE